MAKKEKVSKVTADKEKPSGEAVKPIKQATKPKTKSDGKDIGEMQQLDGKLYNNHGAKSMDEILGENTHKYSTHDVKEYRASLENMNSSDLQRHAATVGVLPKEDRRILIKTLVKHFETTNSAYFNTSQVGPISQQKLSQEALDILAEGA